MAVEGEMGRSIPRREVEYLWDVQKERERGGGGGIFNFLHVGGIDLLWNGPII